MRLFVSAAPRNCLLNWTEWAEYFRVPPCRGSLLPQTLYSEFPSSVTVNTIDEQREEKTKTLRWHTFAQSESKPSHSSPVLNCDWSWSWCGIFTRKLVRRRGGRWPIYCFVWSQLLKLTLCNKTYYLQRRVWPTWVQLIEPFVQLFLLFVKFLSDSNVLL